MPPFQGYPTASQLLSKCKLPRYRKYPKSRYSKSSGIRLYRNPALNYAVRRIVSAELGFTYNHSGPVSLDQDVGDIVHLTDINIGDLQSERKGNWIQPINIHGLITVSADLGGIAQDTPLVRVGILRWKEDMSVVGVPTPPILTDFMHDISNPHGPFKFTGKGKFDIIWTRLCILSNSQENTRRQMLYPFHVNVSKKQRVYYDGTLNRKYHLFYFALSDVPGVDSPPRSQFDITVRYTDS